MKTNVYKQLLKKLHCPEENGYRWRPLPLPNYQHISITTKEDSKYLTVYSEIHMNKEVKYTPTFSLEFTDADIIKDLSSRIIRDYDI